MCMCESTCDGQIFITLCAFAFSTMQTSSQTAQNEHMFQLEYASGPCTEKPALGVTAGMMSCNTKSCEYLALESGLKGCKANEFHMSQ